MDISIIIPTYNRKERLQACLEPLLKQDYPQGLFEIIVIDDGSNDGTKEIVGGIAENHPNTRYFYQCNKGPAASRNFGVRVSTGEIVGFIDDDCVVFTDWVRLMVESHRKNPKASAVGGLTFTPGKKTAVLVSQFLSNGSIETGLNGRPEIIFLPTCNVSFKRRLFDKYSFNERFPFPGGEDLEFFWRLFKEGHKFLWDKEIKITHYRDDSLAGFIKQAYVYGRGNFLVQCLHNDQPLLKELKTGLFSFWIGTLINIIKIPHFSYMMGSWLIRQSNIRNTREKISICAYFVLHKIFYIFGNIAEFISIKKKNYNAQEGLFLPPRLLILDITHSCNLRCRICDIWKTAKSEKDMEIAYIKKTLFQAKGLKIEEITLSGGEALLREDIFEILDYAMSLGIKDLGVLTNGILVKKHIERLKPYIFNNTISLVVSLDSLKQELHNQIRNSPSAWQETMGALKMLSAMKNTCPQVNFNVIAVILNQNLEELPDLAFFVKSLKANSLQFQALLPNNLIMAQRSKSEFWVKEERLSFLDVSINRLMEIKKQEPQFIKNSVNNLSLVKKYYRAALKTSDVSCLSAGKTVLLSNQGRYTTCFDSSYGDVVSQGLEDVLKSRKIIHARQGVKKCAWPCLLPCFCD